MRQVELFNGNEQKTSNFNQSDSIVIVITYDGEKVENISGAGFILYNSDEIRVGGGNTYMSMEPPHKLPKKGKVQFVIQPKQLTPGQYFLTLSLGSHQSVLIDKIELCVSFLVEQNDIYGTGYLLTKEDGVCALNFRAVII